MLYDLGLLFTAIAYAWIARTLFWESRRQRSLLAAGAVVAAGVVWVVSELVLLRSGDPEQLVLARRVLLLAGCALGPLWFWAAARIHLGPAGRELLEQLGVGVVISDAGGSVVHSNRFAEALLALPHLVGRRIEEVERRAVCHPTRSIGLDQSALRRGGSCYGTVTLLEDRTELVATSRRLEIASRFEALGFLVAGVAHEVNNPLAYVRSNLGLLKELMAEIEPRAGELRLSPESLRTAREGNLILADAIDGADRIADLVKRLRTFSHEGGGGSDERNADLALTIRRAMEMARMGAPCDSPRIIHEDSIPTVLAREDDLFQIALQLLINALEASEKRGRVEIELRECQGEVMLRVLDRGPGIAPELLPHVFDPFFTTKNEGHPGLGLSMSYDLARQNQARLEAANRPNGGAAFTLWLQAA